MAGGTTSSMLYNHNTGFRCNSTQGTSQIKWTEIKVMKGNFFEYRFKIRTQTFYAKNVSGYATVMSFVLLLGKTANQNTS
jgi:hypothetical protein